MNTPTRSIPQRAPRGLLLALGLGLGLNAYALASDVAQADPYEQSRGYQMREQAHAERQAEAKARHEAADELRKEHQQRLVAHCSAGPQSASDTEALLDQLAEEHKALRPAMPPEAGAAAPQRAARREQMRAAFEAMQTELAPQQRQQLVDYCASGGHNAMEVAAFLHEQGQQRREFLRGRITPPESGDPRPQ